MGRQGLPTEAEWELAARGGLDGRGLHVGRRAGAARRRLANTWHGDFPWRHAVATARPTPVGSFPPNGYGLYDMAGNVWEWTTDWCRPVTPTTREAPCCVPTDPAAATVDASFDPAQPQFPIPRKVIKGGSHLCADSYCLRYRPAARRPQMIDTGMSHLGFRCITR